MGKNEKMLSDEIVELRHEHEIEDAEADGGERGKVQPRESLEGTSEYNNLAGNIVAKLKGIKISESLNVYINDFLVRRGCVTRREFTYFANRVKAWLQEEKDIVVFVRKRDGAYVGEIRGICEDRLHRSATYERAMARAILNAIEMIKDKE